MASVRKNKTFSGLELDENLKQANIQPRAGIQVIDLETGAAEHWVRLEGVIEELYDIKLLNNVNRPLLIGTQKRGHPNHDLDRRKLMVRIVGASSDYPEYV